MQNTFLGLHGIISCVININDFEAKKISFLAVKNPWKIFEFLRFPVCQQKMSFTKTFYCDFATRNIRIVLWKLIVRKFRRQLQNVSRNFQRHLIFYQEFLKILEDTVHEKNNKSRQIMDCREYFVTVHQRHSYLVSIYLKSFSFLFVRDFLEKKKILFSAKIL